MRFSRTGFLFFFTLLVSTIRSQTNTYILNGSATQDNCNCYTLTRASDFQNGSVWNSTKIDLTRAFDFSFNVFLGCKDGDGADGIVFILQTVASSIGSAGEGLGFAGVVPSIGIALDTYTNSNLNDPVSDHISIQANGNITHGSDLAGPVPILASGANVEDCQWHIFRITWDPVTHDLRAYFDGDLRVEAQVDMVATIFNNDPGVYWGFSAATGGANNVQQFCTALNPEFTTNLSNNSTCVGSGAISFTNNSVSFAPIVSHYWDFGDGTTTTDPNPAPHNYTDPGIYTVKLAITGLDGCLSDTLEKIIAIGDYPIADFDVFDTCSGRAPRIRELSHAEVGNISSWNWLLDGNPVSTAQQPDLGNLSSGMHSLQLDVTSEYGCQSTSTTKQFLVKQTPQINAEADGACVKEPVLFTGTQIDNATTITSWNWDLGNGQQGSQQVISFTYTQAGSYSVQLTATASNGCISDPSIIPLDIVQAVAFAGNDTVIIKNEPFQLHGSGGSSYTWSPATGIDNPLIADPVATLDDDMTYTLTVTTAEGCTDEDYITLTVFKGSDIYVPNAFTPNNDGLNDELKPYYIGIKTLNNFSVYNRWGQRIFSSSDISKAWDGTIGGVQQPSGVFVWRLRAVDYVGKVYEMSGTTTLIR